MFGFECQECHKGVVRAQQRADIPFKVDGIPFNVPEGTVGVCDNCGAEVLSAKECKRWRALFEQMQQQSDRLLCPEDIMGLKAQLGYTTTQLAGLIGATRQSVTQWMNASRVAPQSRMADVLLRLVRECLATDSVEVLPFLTSLARDNGIDLPAPARSRLHMLGRSASPGRAAYDRAFQGRPPSDGTRPSLRVVPQGASDTAA